MGQLGIFLVKLPPLAKLILAGTAASAAVALSGKMDMHDIWFYYVIFIFVSAIVTGMPEPDTSLTGWRFFYTWFYRSGHLLVASATAYFMHSKKWQDISGGDTKEVTASVTQSVTEKNSL